MKDIIPDGMKKCFVCKMLRPATTEFFHKCNRYKDGLRGCCKTCRALQYKEKLQSIIERPEIILCHGCNKEYPCTEEFFYKDGRCKYGLTTRCKVCFYKKRIHYRQAHKDRTNFQIRQRRQNDDVYRSNKLVYERQRRTTDKYKTTSRRRKHSERGRLLNRVYRHARDARIRGIGGRYTDQDIKNQHKRQKGKCYWCKQKLTKYHVDHVIPVTREGSSNNPWNLVLACPYCNESRGNKLPHEWKGSNRLL